MIFAGKTAVFLTAQSAVLAYRPVIKDAYFFLNTVKEFPAASFKMDFNDTLYVENTLTGARFLYSDPSMFAAAPFPFASSGGCDYPQQGGPNQGQQQGDGGMSFKPKSFQIILLTFSFFLCRFWPFLKFYWTKRWPG